MQIGNKWVGLALALSLGLAACESDPTDPVDPPVETGEAVLSKTITGERTLSADTTYLIRGVVTVDSGAALNIPAGTLLLGDADIAGSVLIVRRGGMLNATGTAAEPIVFTSSRPAGQRNRGDWGGVVLNGASHCNFPASECVGEGSSGPYGGSVLDDNSGTLTYVRIEFAGYEVSFGNELNALTLNGVGSGTTIDYVQAHYGSDDGIELFGGTVNVKHAIVTGASDDSFDYSTGWSGKGQFWIVQQDPNDAGAGFEADNNELDYGATPLTNPTIYNVTLVGKGTGGTAGESEIGLHLRRGTAGRIYNAIVLGFEAGLDIDNSESYARCAAGELVAAHSIFFGNGAFNHSDSDDEAACTGLAAWTIRQEDPGLTDPYDRTSPDFRPRSGAAALTGAATPPNDGFFDASATYVGAVAPTGTPWYAGWTTFARN